MIPPGSIGSCDPKLWVNHLLDTQRNPSSNRYPVDLNPQPIEK